MLHDQVVRFQIFYKLRPMGHMYSFICGLIFWKLFTSKADVAEYLQHMGLTFLNNITQALVYNSQGRSGLPCEFDADLW